MSFLNFQGFFSISDPQYVMEYFNNSIHTPEGVGLYTLLQVLRVLLASVSKLKEDNRISLQKDLLALVKRFMIPPELISTSVDIAAIVSWLESGASKGKYKHFFKTRSKKSLISSSVQGSHILDKS